MTMLKEIAHIVLDGGQQMGMPHRRFQGRTDSFKADKARPGRFRERWKHEDGSCKT